MASLQCPISMQFQLEDQIPFVDAEEYCDGSMSSDGTGSVFGHLSSEEDERLARAGQDATQNWQYHENPMFLGDRQSLNNILDTVSTQVQSVDLDYMSLDNSCTISNIGDGLPDSAVMESPATESSCESQDPALVSKKWKTSHYSTRQARPLSLSLRKDVKNFDHQTTLTLAYASLQDQVRVQFKPPCLAVFRNHRTIYFNIFAENFHALVIWVFHFLIDFMDA